MPADGTHDDLVDDTLGQIDMKAVRLHEVYVALSKKGRFTKAQAESFVSELVSEVFAEHLELS